MFDLAPQRADATAKLRIRDAALSLFAVRGYTQTSLRMIANKAGVSPALITHHYASKHGLRRAVDQLVLEELRRAIPQAGDPRTAAEISAAFARVFNHLITSRPEVRGYIRRCFIEDDGGELGNLIDGLVELLEQALDGMQRMGMLHPVEDTSWRALQVLLVMLGPTIFEPALQARMPQLFGREAMERRFRANLDLFGRGLYRLAVETAD